MTTFTTVDLNNLNTNREIFRMSGNRFMEVLWQVANTTEAEYKIMRVVDMGDPGVDATVVSPAYILPNTMPIDVSLFVRGSIGMYIDGESIGTSTGGTYDARGYYGASVPMSSTQLLITYSNKMYRFTYDEGGTNEIIFDGEVTQIGGTLPECIRYGDAQNGNASTLTSETGLYRMGSSNSFIVNRQPKNAPTTNISPDASDAGVFQIWEYDSVANTITLQVTESNAYNGIASGSYIREIPGSNSVYVGRWASGNFDPTEDLTDDLDIRESYVYNTDGTRTTLHTSSTNPRGYIPLILSATEIWWAGRLTAHFKDYQTPANNKTITYAKGALPLGTTTVTSNPNEGWAVSDTEFVAVRNFSNGTMDLIAVKDVGFGFGEFSPNGKQSIGEVVATYTGQFSEEFEAEFIDFHSNKGSGEFGNAIYRIDADTYQYECVAVKAVSGSPGANNAKLYQYRIKRA